MAKRIFETKDARSQILNCSEHCRIVTLDLAFAINGHNQMQIVCHSDEETAEVLNFVSAR